MSRDQLRIVIARDINSSWDDLRIYTALLEFTQAYQADDRLFQSFAVVFAGGEIETEAAFEQALWSRVQSLADKDAWHGQSYDERVSSDPGNPHFSLSFGGEAFFVVGLHPAASRPARRFERPVLVFNLHDQFERLRLGGPLRAAAQQDHRARRGGGRFGQSHAVPPWRNLGGAAIQRPSGGRRLGRALHSAKGSRTCPVRSPRALGRGLSAEQGAEAPGDRPPGASRCRICWPSTPTTPGKLYPRDGRSTMPASCSSPPGDSAVFQPQQRHAAHPGGYRRAARLPADSVFEGHLPHHLWRHRSASGLFRQPGRGLGPLWHRRRPDSHGLQRVHERSWWHPTAP